MRVEGNITSIGKMTSSDIMVYPSYSGVSGAGKVTLRLQARVTNTTDYSGNIKCTVEKPYDTIDVVFDEVSEKTVPVTVDASAVSIADGYMLNKTSAVPAEITLRGPTSELDQISQVVAPVTTRWPTPPPRPPRWSCGTRTATPSPRSTPRWTAIPPTSR